MGSRRLSRRDFVSAAAGIGAATFATRFSVAGEPPRVVNPRATSGDERFEPDWEERLTISVGPKQADIVGATDTTVQAAMDYAARIGGATVKILPGEYRFRNSVVVPSRIRIVGSGLDSVIAKCESVSTPLDDDADWYDQEITLKDARGFKLGDGVFLEQKVASEGGPAALKRTLVARDGNRFKLDKPLRKNLWLKSAPTCASLPLFTGENVHDVSIADLTFDGNKANNLNLNGNYGGCIWMQDCARLTFRDLTTRNYNGDGISWQICHDVLVERCHSHDNADLGLHPGSGSQRPIIRDCKLERNGIGIFWCWGVKFGLAENNDIADSARYGTSIGHNDTDNVMRGNRIARSGEVGVLFRDDARGKDFWPNRNVVEKNVILDSGGESGVAIDVHGRTRDVAICENELRETRGPAQRVGVRLGPETADVRLENNTFAGFSLETRDMRASRESPRGKLRKHLTVERNV